MTQTHQRRTALALHGGAGLVRKHCLSAEREARCHAVLSAALRAGDDLLRAGAPAAEAVIAAVVVMEEAPEFNAGRGSVFAADGTQRMDAAVLCGHDRSYGAVAAVRTLRSPIRAANLVRLLGPHVLLVADEAEAWCAEHGAETADAAWFWDADRWAHLQLARNAGRTALDHELEEDPKGTVGAVALDVYGHLAAATSTGGLANKHPGRVGDSPIAGAGTWADDAVAISVTGTGEAILRARTAGRVADWMAIGGLDLASACRRAVAELEALGGVGGMIAIDRGGRLQLPFGSAGMYRGFRDTEGNTETAIW